MQEELNTKRLITESVKKRLAEKIIEYAKANNMTISNIRQSMELVEKHLRDNAILEKEDSEESKSS